MPRTRHIAGAIAAALLFSTAASATDFSKVVVIGDSLSDAGNIAAANGSPIPLRFTTNPGYTTAENVAAALGLPVTASLTGGTDYAFGGAGLVHNSAAGPIPLMPQQWGMYLAANGGKADPNALYQVWGGANDIFYLTAVSQDPTFLAAGVQQAAQTELGLLAQMQANGAKYVIVYNLPDIGKTPASAAGGAAAQQGGSQLSTLFNSVLEVGLNQLSNKGLNVIPVNTYAVLNEVIANPSAYGFTNVTTPACTVSSSINCTPNTLVDPNAAKTYLFADGVHPTTAAHAMLSQYVVSVIRAPSQVSLLGEAPLAAAAAQGRAIRNEMLADGMGSDTRAFASIDYGQQTFKGQGLSPKTDSDNVNLTLGADVKASDNWSLGVAMGIGQHNADFQGGGGYKLQDISGLGYVTWHQAGGYVGGYVSFGQSNFSDIERRIQLGAATRTESGKADGSHLGGGLTGGYWFDFSGLRTGPFANVEWQTVKVNGYAESGSSSTSMWFNRQQRDALISTVGWRLQGHWQTSSMLLQPYAEVAWNHDSKADPRAITAGLNSMAGFFSLTGFSPDGTWGTADLGISAQFTQNITGWLGYTGRFSDNSQKFNSINAGVKFGF
ncbi:MULTISPECIES: autotransporter outer membrane beta-barrel domain-containing protein [Dyella]|uniref:Autotransporter domain-containing protein n=2 Tax=Dyella TaxID=231454 RepID=A0A4R0YDF0_9GAMM|nr:MULTISPECIES: autotransporter domain-containing protein [Dyella]TBR36025.1 autotransporter domain-containing protein [Dyella terrae]TCI06074.1 autotransporter domain-containing protein [Dyella soli]